MKGEVITRKRPSLSLPILRTSRSHHRAGTLTLGNLLSAMGETSFGWAIVVFSLLTLLPLPPGFTLLTALPLLVTTGQMILGYSHVNLPNFLARQRLDHPKLRQAVVRLRPITRRLERVLRPRYTGLFARRNERTLGVFLFVIAFALFLPIPLSGWFPAISLFTVGVGFVERDGLVTMVGIVMGGLSVLLTIAVMMSLVAGAEALLH